MKDQSSDDKWRTGCIFNNQFSVQENRHETAGKIRLLLQIPHAVASLIIFDYGIWGYFAAAGGASVAGAIAVYICSALGFAIQI